MHVSDCWDLASGPSRAVSDGDAHNDDSDLFKVICALIISQKCMLPTFPPDNGPAIISRVTFTSLS